MFLRLIPLLLLLAACRPDDGTVTLEMWGIGREGQVVGELLVDFEREHPGIRVKVQQLPWTAAHEKLLTAYVGEAMPDLFQLGNTWIPEFATLGALEPLDARVAASATVDRADYFPGIWATNMLDSTTYGVPWYVDTRLLFYRTDLLAEAGYDEVPTTWEGWAEAMAAIKANQGDDRYAVLLPLNEFEPQLILALQMEDRMLRDGDQYGNFRSEDFRRALGFYLRMFREGWAPAISAAQISNVWQEFAKGYFAFYITGPWNIGEFKRRLPAAVQDKWMTAPMPGPDSLTAGRSVAGGASLVLSRTTEHAEEAWQLVEYLSRPDVQLRFHALTGNLPPRETAWEDSTFRADPYTHAFRAQLRHVRPTPGVPEWERISTLVRLYAEEVVYERLTLDEAVTALDAEVDQILEKRRWLLARTE